MFSREHWQIKLAYAGFGALLLFIGMMLSPVTAQRDKFREIECTALRVVDPATGEVRSMVATNKDGGVIEVYGNDGKHKVRLGVLVDGGWVNVSGPDGDSGVSLLVPANLATVTLSYKTGDPGVKLTVIGEHGGGMFVSDVTGKPAAQLSVDEHGGRVVVWGSVHKSAAGLAVQDGGGRVEVWDKDGDSRGGLWVNSEGNGVVSTRDENGWYHR